MQDIVLIKLYMEMMPNNTLMNGYIYGMETNGLVCFETEHLERVRFVVDQLRDAPPATVQAFKGLLLEDFEARCPHMVPIKGIQIQVCNSHDNGRDHVILFVNGKPFAADQELDYYADFYEIAEAFGVELDFQNYFDTEEKMRLLLEKHEIRAYFSDGERDSFGPLSRVVKLRHLPTDTTIMCCYG